MKTKLLIYILISLMLGQLTVVNAQEVDIPDDSVWSLAWSPDSTHIAAARYNGIVEIQSALTGLVEKTLQSGFISQITAVAWSPDGTRIAGSNELKSVFLWDTNTGLLIRTLQGQITDHITNLAWSSDSTFIAGVSQFDGKLQIWNADTGQLLIDEWAGYLEGLDWIDTRIISAVASGVVLFDSNTGEYIKDIGLQNVYIDSVAWSPDGNRVVSGGMDGVVRIWDANASQEILVLSGHTLPVPSVDWSPDGSSVVSASLDGTVLIWNSTTGQLIKTIQVGAPLLSVKFSPNGNQLAYSGDVVGVGETVTIIPAPTTVSSLILFASTDDFLLYIDGRDADFRPKF